MGLDSVELIMTVETTFDLSIPDQEAEKLDTVGKLYQFILDDFEETVSEEQQNEIWERLKAMIVEQLAIKPEQVTKEANFVYDLGMD